ncbi:DJ-1/PfpI family protein [Williamsia maris]|uniref:DJ-1/PfpI family protein n=1 Tax=Williamsia maris TaxID=72806 RepID=A0ABT1HJK5_9NOCA|nr:DJ-1/PfpI family protein [Williamsia maris]MCP2178108.1 DJ-1/PfpI family protein [Williamsia maris]
MIIAMGLFPKFTALDLVGPYQVFASMPGVQVVLCAEKPGMVTDDNGLIEIQVDNAFDEVAEPDIVVIPGGQGARDEARAHGPIVDWVAATHPTTRWTSSVCTGSLILAAAGLLNGVHATTHWCFYDELASHGAIPSDQRVVMNNRVATAAGVSAGIDLALTLVGEVESPTMAQAIQLGIEYDPRPPFDSGSPSKADPELRDLVFALMTRPGQWTPG